ncbi:93_t:CDS:2, partial [Entrophospora sp. SA101]
PTCICATTNPPGGIPVEKAPQFVLLTFDDSIQERTLKVVNDLLGNRRNPNGCPIGTTYYVSLNYTDYSLVTQWYAKGHEVADHTMTHAAGLPRPLDEIVGNKKALNAFAGIPLGKISGFRVPFLEINPNLYQILADQKFVYDTSATSIGTDDSWPYTLDNGLYSGCYKGFCDQVKHPGLFEVPMAAILDDKNTPHLMDPLLDYAGDKLKLLQDNFVRHTKNGKVPFGLYLHPVQYSIESIAPGIPDPTPTLNIMKDFLDWAIKQPDVWFVTNQQLIEYMKNPVPADQLKTYEAFQCKQATVGKEICNGMDDNGDKQIDEGLTLNCNFNTEVFNTCYGCPKTLPSLDTPVPDSTTNLRFRVPTTCDTVWWDPIANMCLCNSASCAYKDISQIPDITTTNTTSSSSTTTSSAASSTPTVSFTSNANYLTTNLQFKLTGFIAIFIFTKILQKFL